MQKIDKLRLVIMNKEKFIINLYLYLKDNKFISLRDKNIILMKMNIYSDK